MRRIVSVARREHVRCDLAADCIDCEVQRAPLPLGTAMLLGVSLTLAEHLQPRPVQHQVDGSVVPDGP